MPPGGTLPGIEQAPKLPERSSEAPEHGAAFESVPAHVERPVEASPAPAAPVPAPAPAAPRAPAKDPTVGVVERVMEEGIEEAYRKMSPGLQRAFKARGEKAAVAIADMVRRAKVNVGQVLKLLTSWLKMIPGVNRFFLIQEAKLKTDKLVALAEERKKGQGIL